MRKLVALLVCAMLVLGAVTCASADKVHLTMGWWGNQSRNDTFLAIHEQYMAENPDVEIEGQFVSWGDYWEKLAIAASNKALPDVILMDYSYMTQYLNDGYLADLTPYVESGVIDLSKFDQGIIDSASRDGRIYAVCSNINAPALLYNKTLLDNNGIEIHDNMTMDEFIEVCKQVYEKTGVKTDFAYACNQPLDYYLRGRGSNLFTDGRMTATVDDLKAYFTIFEQGIADGWMLPGDVYASLDISSVEQNPVVYGSTPDSMSWCTTLWSNQLSALQSSAPEGIEIGITTWPSDNPTASNYLKPGGFFAVTSNANVEEAAKLVNYFANNLEAGKAQALIGSIMPASNVAEYTAQFLSEVNKRSVEYINNVVTPNCSSLPEAEPDGANEFFAKMAELEEQLCYGTTNAETAANELYNYGVSIFNK